MAGTVTETVTGGVVLAAAVAFVLYGGQLAGFGRGGGSYPLVASFRSIEGVTVGTDIRMAGVKVGTVSGLKLNPQTFFADATLAIDEDVPLPDDSEARIALGRSPRRVVRRTAAGRVDVELCLGR